MSSMELGDLSEIRERLVRVETMLTDTHRRLFGNGQPGEVDVLKERVATLERWMWRVGGALGVLTFLLHGAESIRQLLSTH